MSDDTPTNALAFRGEALVDYLKRRERELIQQTAALRGMLAPKDQELASVRQAMQAIGLPLNYTEALKPFLDENQNSLPGLLNADPSSLNALSENLTIKKMIQNALSDHFTEGASPSELSEYMLTAYGREEDRNSISPQLARLRDEGLVRPMAMTGKWERAPSAGLVEFFNRATARRPQTENDE